MNVNRKKQPCFLFFLLLLPPPTDGGGGKANGAATLAPLNCCWSPEQHGPGSADGLAKGH